LNPINVLVTGVGGGGHGEQILKALRLAKTPYHIIGGDISIMSKGLTEVDEAVILPPAQAPNYISTLLQLCKKEAIQVVFHGSEPELKILSKERHLFKENNIFLPINPEKVIDICMDKNKTITFLEEKGFDVPKTKKVTSLDDVKNLNILPAILKPSVEGGGSNGVLLAQSQDELELFTKYLLSQFSELIIQEYMGSPESEFTVGVLISMKGELLNSIAVKRYLNSSLSSRIRVKNRSSKKRIGNPSHYQQWNFPR